MVGVLSILLAGFLLVRSDAITLGAATAAAFYFTRLFSPLMMMLYLLDEAQSAGAALARLIGVTDLPPPRRPGMPRTPADASVALTRVAFGYEDGPEVLHGIDLALARASGWRWSGPAAPARPPSARSSPASVSRARGRSGSAAYRWPSSPTCGGTWCWSPRRCTSSPGRWRTTCGSPGPRPSDAELRAALEQVGVDLDLDAVVGHGADELSATHAQQLALTRLVLADPDIAILDEATAEAGSAGARVLEATAERALRGRTAIVIAHRLTQAVDADRVVVMEKGRVVEVGRHADLVRTDGPYARLWSAWTSAR